MQTLLQDLRYGGRILWKNPGFTLLVVMLLALGIGANTTIFSNVDATLLRPFSFSNQARLVVLFEQKPSIGITQAKVSPGNVMEWRAQSQTLQEIVVMRTRQHTLTSDGPAEQYLSYGVSAAFFEALGVKPFLGRTFQPGEDEAGRAQVTVLRHAFWQTRFGGDPQIVGKQILLDDKPFNVIGVMPKDFDFPFGGGEMWTPFVFDPQMKQDHSGHYLNVLALLKPGVTVAQTNAELEQIAQRLAQKYPNDEAGHSAYAVAVNDEYTRGAKMYLPVSIGSVIFVLLIACANVANLLLVRASARHKELALRLALGATPGRLVRQLLTESVMLSLAGGALGILLANWGIEAIRRGVPTAMSKYIPGWSHLGMNYRVLGFALLISVLTGVIFGLVPALQATRTNLNETLKEGGGKGASDRGSGGGALSMRNVLVVAEIALSLVLLIGAGLFVRSFVQMLRTDLGVNAANVMTMNVALPRDKYADLQQLRNFFGQLIERSAALPGVTNVGAVHALPLGGGSDGNSFQIVGQPSFEKGKEPHTYFRIATPDYFAAIGTQLRQGRLFAASDDAQAPRVVLANEAFVARFLPGGEVLGKRITMGSDKEKAMEIIGVVTNVMNEDLDNMTEPCVYLPFAQNPVASMSLVLRAPGTHTQLGPAVRRELSALDPRLPLSEVKTMEQVIHERRSPLKLMMWMLVIFGLMALAMAAVGTYAVMAYAVAQRTHEIGVRLALGAQSADIFQLILRRGLMLGLVGIGLGLAGAFALTRALGQLLYGVTTTDTLTFTGVTLLLAAVALLACWIPAQRATKVDPMIALRCE